jgi:hypothetical protein
MLHEQTQSETPDDDPKRPEGSMLNPRRYNQRKGRWHVHEAKGHTDISASIAAWLILPPNAGSVGHLRDTGEGLSRRPHGVHPIVQADER